MKEEQILRESGLPVYRYDKGTRNYEYEVVVFIDNVAIKKVRCNGKTVEDAIHTKTGYRVKLRRTNGENDCDIAVLRIENSKLSNKKPLYYVIESAWQSRGQGVSKGYKRKVYVDWQTGKPIS